MPFVASRATNGNRKIGRQMANENPVSNDFLSTFVDSINVFDCRLSGVKLLKYLKDIQLIFIASYRMTNEPRHVISNKVAFKHE